MKKILLSLGMIVFVGAAAWGATGAFFTDAETSTGNTFTAGTLDLQVDSTSHYDGLVCVANVEVPGFHWAQDPNVQGNQRPDLIGQPCSGSWTQRDLGPGNQFFNFSDIKPGDNGENTISLHTTNNAWICANITTTSNSDNTVIAPEIAAGDNASSTVGELAQNTFVFGWTDNASTSGAVPGDNIWQAGETVLFQPTALSAIASGTPLSLPLADSRHGSAIVASTTNYIGVAWCTGTMNVSVPGTITCSGATLGNIIQTDSATADITLTATQSRNNPTFTCGGATTTAPIVVTANDLETNIANAPTSKKWYFYDDTADALNNALGSFVVGPSTPPLGTGSAQNNALAAANSRTLFTNSGFGGVALSAISQLSYGDYQPSGAWSATEAPFFRFNVDFGTSTAFQGSLVFVPSVNGSVVQNTWQNWDMISGGTALWSYSRNFWPAGITTVANTVPGTTARTWASILADYPAIKMHALFPQLGFRTGEPGPAGLTANIDNFQINTGSGTQTYNFGN